MCHFNFENPADNGSNGNNGGNDGNGSNDGNGVNTIPDRIATAAGVLANDKADKKHLSFLIYSLALLFGGLFGLDSFIVGDKQSGFIRLVCLITGILAPIAIIWWLFNVGKFFLKTKDVTSQYWEYFGAPPPSNYGQSILEKIINKIPLLEKIFGPINNVKNNVSNAVETAEDLAEGLTENPVASILGLSDFSQTTVPK